MTWAALILSAFAVVLGIAQLAVTLLILLPDVHKLHPKKR